MAFVFYPQTRSPSPTFYLNSHFRDDSTVSSSFSSLFCSSVRLLATRSTQQRSDFRSVGYYRVKCGFTKVNDSSSTSLDNLNKEPHKYFDHVVISVRSGDGGHGAVLSMTNQKYSLKYAKKFKEKPRKKSSYKRDIDGSLILPVGGRGADVVIYVDESKDSLLEFHEKNRYNGKRGGNVDAMGVLSSQLQDGVSAPTLRIPVPIGTVVKRKRGKLLADLAKPGDEVLVARGGQGGISLLEAPHHKSKSMMSFTTNVLRDDSDKDSLCCASLLNFQVMSMVRKKARHKIILPQQSGYRSRGANSKEIDSVGLRSNDSRTTKMIEPRRGSG